MGTIKRLVAGRLYPREVMRIRRVSASFMLLATLFYMTSLNVIVASALEETVTPPTSTAAATPKEELSPSEKESTETKEEVKEEIAKEDSSLEKPAQSEKSSETEESSVVAEEPKEEPAKEAVSDVKDPVANSETNPKEESVSAPAETGNISVPDKTKESGSTDSDPTNNPGGSLVPETPVAPSDVQSPVIDPTEPATEQVAEEEKDEWEVSADDKDTYTTVSTVEVSHEYTAPQNDKLKIKFTRIPIPAGKLTIREIKLSKDEVAKLGVLGDRLYDITSDMPNGSFEYDLTLPLPENTNFTADRVEVKYAEKLDDLFSAKAPVIEEKKEEINTVEDTLKVNDLNHFTIFAIVGSASNIPDADNSQGLTAVSPTTNATTGFPDWYQDGNGVKLGLCNDQADPNCGAPTPAESFYWSAESSMVLGGGGQALLVMALEAAYATGDPAPNEQAVFTRIRIRIDAPVAGTYTVIHPFGNKTYNVTTPGPNAINDTVDVGFVPLDFNAALNGNIGPFLTASSPAAPAGYIGRPTVEQTVTGSPTGKNYFEIQGPAGSSLGGPGTDTIRNNGFLVTGKIFVDPALPQPLSVSVDAQATTSTTPTITGKLTGDLTNVTIAVTVDGQPVTATLDKIAKTWNATIAAPLATGFHEISVTATDSITAEAVTDATTNELEIIVIAQNGQAGLSAVSPVISGTNGFPIWYQDANGLKLGLCSDPTDLNCVADPVIVGNARSEQTGFGSEAFYFLASSVINSDGGGQALVENALEAAYGTPDGSPAAGQEMVFSRLRIRIDAPVSGTYTVTHPFGTKTYNVTTPGRRAINDTIDIGITPLAFAQALAGNVGPFLRAASPGAPAGYVGNALGEQTVIGSPLGTNYVEIQGPAGSNLGGTGVDTVKKTTFNLAGKIFVPTGNLEVSVNPQTATTATPTITGGVSDPAATVNILVNGQTIAATVDAATGAWTAAVPVALADGTYDVTVTANSGVTTANDVTTNELVVNTAPDTTGLTAVSPTTNATTGFPDWYQDQNGIKLTLCGDPADPKCITSPVIVGNAQSEQSGFGAEAFYWNGTAKIDFANGGQAILVTGLEAAYATPDGSPAAAEQTVFTRVRVRIDAPTAGTYTVVHPFGTKTYTILPGGEGPNAINDTIDIGGVTALDFTTPLTGNVGPFLTAVSPAAPVGYIGNPGTNQTVTGSPTGNNFFEVQGPVGSNLGGTGDTAHTDLFALSGKLFVAPGTPVITVNPVIVTTTTPIITGTVAGSAAATTTVTVTVGGQVIAATVDAVTGAFTAAIPTPLADGVFDVAVTATDTATGLTASDFTTGELTVNADPANPPVAVTPITSNVATPTIIGTIVDPTNTNLSVTVGGQTAVVTVSPGGTWSAQVATPLANGTYEVAATITNAAGATYTDTTANELIVDTPAKLVPVITWNVPETVAYGVAIGGTQLNATASVPGAFVYSPAGGTVLTPGTQTLSVTFTPTDTVTYNTVTETRTILQLSANQKTPDDVTGDVTVDDDAPEVVVTNSGKPVNVTVTSGTSNPKVNYDSLVTDGKGVIPQTSIDCDSAEIDIPEATEITSDDSTWNGVMAAPVVKSITLPQVSGTTRTLSTAVEVGVSGSTLSFDKGVRILLRGQVGKKVGFSREGTGTDFSEITTICSMDSQLAGNALPAGKECKINVGADLVIWTKHFTTFAAYSETTNAVTIPSPNDDNDDDDDDDDDDDTNVVTNFFGTGTASGSSQSLVSTTGSEDLTEEEDDFTEEEESDIQEIDNQIAALNNGEGQVAGEEFAASPGSESSPLRKALPLVGAMIVLGAGIWWWLVRREPIS